ncbi:4296_t:CDS:2, partial [Funneliformis caledonium]
SQVLSIIEIKPDQLMRQLLDNGLDLYEAYNRALTAADDELLCLLNIIRSLDTHLAIWSLMTFDTMLTTYVRTWFSTVIITIRTSSIFSCNQNHMSTQASFLECVYYHETLFTLKCTPLSPTDNEKLEDMKNYERSQFSFVDVLGNVRSGVSIEAKLCGKLLTFGILNEVFVFILTSLSGKSFAELDDVTEREKQLAIEGLQAMHARGVIHGMLGDGDDGNGDDLFHKSRTIYCYPIKKQIRLESFHGVPDVPSGVTTFHRHP